MEEMNLYCQSCERVEEHRKEDENEQAILWECQVCESVTYTQK